MDQAYSEAPKGEITILLPNGKEMKGQAFVTTPYNIVKQLGQKLAEDAVAAKVVYSKRGEFKYSQGCVSAEVEDLKAEE